MIIFVNLTRVVTKISSCRVFVVGSRGSRKLSWSPQEVFEVQLLPFSERRYRPKKAIFIKSRAIISGFMMITSLLKKTTAFRQTRRMLDSEVLNHNDTLQMLKMWKGKSLYGANELTCAVKSIVNSLFSYT